MEESWIERIKLIVITNGPEPERHIEIAKMAVEGGARAVQFRDKSMNDRVFTETAMKIKDISDSKGALFFVNDRVHVAKAVGADGVHIGVYDLPVWAARKILGSDSIIGYSPCSIKDAKEAVRQGADYLGVGPISKSPTKDDAGEPIGIEGLVEYIKEKIAPVVAVGGINEKNAGLVVSKGAAGVAVASAVYSSCDMKSKTSFLIETVERAIKERKVKR